jgi:hypothetical protein
MTVRPVPDVLPSPPSDDPCATDQITYLELQVPRDLSETVLRHHRNLLQLCRTLQQAGLNETAIAAHIDTAVESYRAALILSVEKLRSEND